EAIYIKHCNNGLLKAKEVHVGAYLLGTEVDAERVFVDRHKGKIIGGHIRARDRIESAYAGNTHERPTHLEVVGIPKRHLKLEATKLAEQLKIEQDSLEQLESNVEKVRAFKDRLVGHQKESYETLEQEIMKKKDLMKRIELAIYKNLQQMKIQVTPQIEVTREAHPGVVIQIEKKQSVLHAPTKGVFEIIGDDLNV
ncbi:MAG TPA: FapA family protein, partial [Savagea sp.]